MGNCNKEKYSGNAAQDKVFEAIKSGAFRQLSAIVSFYNFSSGMESLDQLQTKHRNITTNALGLCLLLGKANMFKFLLENKADIKIMEKNFEISQLNSIEYVCRKGYLELLSLYLPLYLDYKSSTDPESFISYSLALSKSFACNRKQLPIHSACHNGNVELVKYLIDFFKTSSSVPSEFNIETLEDLTEENCALIACKEGHFNLVKFLHTKCNANFHLINGFKENAIIVTIAGMNRNLNYDYINILTYIVDTVQVDILYKHEEALVLAKCRSVYNFLAKRLNKIGVYVEKKDFEEGSFVCSKHMADQFYIKKEEIFSPSFVKNIKEDEYCRSVPSSIQESLGHTDIKDKDSLILF